MVEPLIEQVLELFIHSGTKAKVTSAYSAALRYYLSGITLLCIQLARLFHYSKKDIGI
jgi:hypothetical protein